MGKRKQNTVNVQPEVQKDNVQPEVKVDNTEAQDAKVEPEVETNNETQDVKVEAKVDDIELQDKPEVKKQHKAPLTAKDVSDLLKNKKFKDAIEVGKTIPELKDIADGLSRYVEHYKKVSPDEYVRHNYSIYTVIKNIINDTDFNRFNVRFRYLINVLCKGEKEKELSELTFLQYDYKWQWGGAEYNRFSKLISVIFTACERGIKQVAKVADIDRLGEVLTPEARNNLKRFF